jgi:hypothetical protein
MTAGPGERRVIYWVAYQRGSFSLKERYSCPRQARDRCNHLVTQARYIRIISATAEDPHLAHCVELPSSPAEANRHFS